MVAGCIVGGPRSLPFVCVCTMQFQTVGVPLAMVDCGVCLERLRVLEIFKDLVVENHGDGCAVHVLGSPAKPHVGFQ